MRSCSIAENFSNYEGLQLQVCNSAGISNEIKELYSEMSHAFFVWSDDDRGAVTSTFKTPCIGHPVSTGEESGSSTVSKSLQLKKECFEMSSKKEVEVPSNETKELYSEMSQAFFVWSDDDRGAVTSTFKTPCIGHPVSTGEVSESSTVSES
jgi:hypothetical protein